MNQQQEQQKQKEKAKATETQQDENTRINNRIKELRNTFKAFAAFSYSGFKLWQCPHHGA